MGNIANGRVFKDARKSRKTGHDFLSCIGLVFSAHVAEFIQRRRHPADTATISGRGSVYFGGDFVSQTDACA